MGLFVVFSNVKVSLTENAALKEGKLNETETELQRTKATSTRYAQALFFFHCHLYKLFSFVYYQFCIGILIHLYH